MRYQLLLLSLVFSSLLQAQTTVGLVAFYPFNTGFADVTGNTANAGIPEGNPGFACGAVGGALRLDGIDDEVAFIGPVTREFDTDDITVSFYFKPLGGGGTQYILSKRWTDCKLENAFYVRYAPLTRTLNIFLGENESKSVSFVERLDADRCWHHVVIARQGTRVRLYLNGRLRRELFTTTRINLLNDGDLVVGNSRCLAPNETRFNGLVDELRVYFRALDELEARALYIAPDKILNRDTLIYLGGSVQINLSNSCATSFSWSPAEDLDFPNNPNPKITPTKPGQQTYLVRMSDNLSNCVATDTIRLNVVDPADLDCNTIFLPKAFTPNGDGLNDTYGISNPFAIRELIAFEIFDRWGGRVFFTNDPFDRWDGSFSGTAVNSGVFLYRIRYLCEGQEKVLAGSVTVMR